MNSIVSKTLKHSKQQLHKHSSIHLSTHTKVMLSTSHLQTHKQRTCRGQQLSASAACLHPQLCPSSPPGPYPVLLFLHSKRVEWQDQPGPRTANKTQSELNGTENRHYGFFSRRWPPQAHLSQKCGVVITAQHRHSQVVQVLAGFNDLFRKVGGVVVLQSQGRDGARVDGGQFEIMDAAGGSSSGCAMIHVRSWMQW